MRKKIIAGNWKMNMTQSEAESLLDKIVVGCNSDRCDVIFCPPYIDLQLALSKTEGKKISIGAQNFYFEDKGAFTGEISANMLTDMGVEYVIIGHSERRELFFETDEIVNKKVKKALQSGLKPILCCGETLSQREKNIESDFIRQQIKLALYGVNSQEINNVIIAYEPIWAIGTGKVATPVQAQEICVLIRNTIEELYTKEVAENIKILYGGSVKSGNAGELFTKPDIDGALVGGASLTEDFVDIINMI